MTNARALLLTALVMLGACGSQPERNGEPVDTSMPPITPPVPVESFRRASGVSSDVNSIVLAPDGSGDFYVGGQFSFATGGSSPAIARFHSDGSHDTSFAAGTGFDEPVLALAAASDNSGDIYCVGYFTTYQDVPANRIIRLNPDGTRDATFSIGTGFNLTVRAVLTLADPSGDILVAGEFGSYNGTTCSRVVRLNADGSIDGAFTSGSGFNLNVTAMTLAMDGTGDICCVGQFSSYNGNPCTRIARIHPNGVFDSAFVTGSGFVGYPWSIDAAVDGSGDVYATGSFNNYQGTPVGRVIRINRDGSHDPGFVAPSNYTSVLGIRAIPDGSGRVLLAAGAAGGLVRLNADGTVDSTFETGTGFSGAVNSIAFFNGTYTVGGSFTTYDGHGADRIIRINEDGTVDSSFATGSGLTLAGNALAAADDGSGDFYVGGSFTSYDGAPRKGIARITSTGHTQETFNPGAGISGAVFSLVSTGDGSGDVYAAGNFSSYDGAPCGGILRIKSDGTQDATFATGGGFGVGFPMKLALATDGSGDLFAGGWFSSYAGTATSSWILRINPDGTRDASFDASGFNGWVTSVTPTTDGSGDIYACGYFTTYQGVTCNGLVRLNADGSRDLAFDIGTGFNSFVYAICEAGDESGDIYVGGLYTQYRGATQNGLARLHSDGSLDTAFVVGVGFDSQVVSLSPSEDGSDLYVGGTFLTYDGFATRGIVRLQADGSVDTAFAVGLGAAGTVSDILRLAPDSQELIAVGNFRTYGGLLTDYIARIGANGISR